MKRDAVQTLLLGIITCGIYYLYLIYQYSLEIDEICNDHRNNPGLDLLLCICTCGLYTIYWFYKVARQIEILQEDLGMHKNSISIICPLLTAFQLGFVAMPILVSEVNRCIDEKAVY